MPIGAICGRIEPEPAITKQIVLTSQQALGARGSMTWTIRELSADPVDELSPQSRSNYEALRRADKILGEGDVRIKSALISQRRADAAQSRIGRETPQQSPSVPSGRDDSGGNAVDGDPGRGRRSPGDLGRTHP